MGRANNDVCKGRALLKPPFKHYITMYVFMICSNIVPFLFQLTFHKKEECYRHFHLLLQTKRATHSYIKNREDRNIYPNTINFILKVGSSYQYKINDDKTVSFRTTNMEEFS